MSARTIAKVSGGEGSWLAARVDLDRRGGTLETLFTDTLCEDQDTYRFLVASNANLFGIDLPRGFLPEISDFPAWEDRPAYKAFVLHLALETMRLMPGFHWIADGRDPWDIYEHERFLGNSRVDPCSKLLKREFADRWLKENCDPSDTRVLVGIDYEEEHRFNGREATDTRPATKGLHARMAEEGWWFEAPLCEPPLISYAGVRAAVAKAGLWQQRLSRLGFAHSNCGGFCCKGGQGHWRLMLRAFPERYAYAEWREQIIRDLLGDVSMLTDRRGGDGKKPLTLKQLRTRDLTEAEAAEMGACGCYFGDAA